METILSKTAMQSPDIFIEMSRKLGSGVEYIRPLLECTSTCPSVRSNPQVLTHLARVVASLTYASRESMTALMAYFNPSLDFVAFDAEHTPEDEQKVCDNDLPDLLYFVLVIFCLYFNIILFILCNI